MYKTLLVPVDGRSKSTRSLELACRIASTFDSHLIGLFVKPSTFIPSAVRAEGAEKLLRELQEKVAAELTQEARARFDSVVKPAGMQRAEWRVAEGARADAVALHARYADLVVINQTDPDSVDATHFADGVLLAVGRPVLLVPYVGESSRFARNVLICWNTSREASRAVTDALPLLKAAEKVTVLTVDGEASRAGHGESPGSDIALYLARHGINAVAAQTVSASVDIGSVILSRAFDMRADLIVMGAYGHSRAREIVLGGATRTVLQSMTVPVLMSH
jgi:nucleotide-binding universal stress UspA family protein